MLLLPCFGEIKTYNRNTRNNRIRKVSLCVYIGSGRRRTEERGVPRRRSHAMCTSGYRSTLVNWRSSLRSRLRDDSAMDRWADSQSLNPLTRIFPSPEWHSLFGVNPCRTLWRWSEFSPRFFSSYLFSYLYLEFSCINWTFCCCSGLSVVVTVKEWSQENQTYGIHRKWTVLNSCTSFASLTCVWSTESMEI